MRHRLITLDALTAARRAEPATLTYDSWRTIRRSAGARPAGVARGRRRAEEGRCDRSFAPSAGCSWRSSGRSCCSSSLSSANLAYRGDYAIAGVSIDDVAAGREPVLLGLRGVRGTAAAWAAAWAALFLAVVFGPYRRGDVATWWGILASVIVLGAVAGARVPAHAAPDAGPARRSSSWSSSWSRCCSTSGG